MAFLTRVLVLTNSLLQALYTTSMILVLRAMASDPQEKLPVSSLRALYFLFPPLTLRVWILWGASLVMAAGLANSNFLFFLMGHFFPPLTLRVWILWGASLVIAAGLANSNFLFFLMGHFFPPVARRLCQ